MTQHEIDNFMSRLTGKGNNTPGVKLPGESSQGRADALCDRLGGKPTAERASETLPGVKPSAGRTPVFREHTGRQTGEGRGT